MLKSERSSVGQLNNKRTFDWRFKTGVSNRKKLSVFPSDPHFWSWLAGIIDGEGYFKVVVKRKITSGVGFEVMPCIDICQGVARKEQMRSLASNLGNVVVSEHPSPIMGGSMCRININGLDDIKFVLEKVQPYLRFKKDDAEVFGQIVGKISEGQHLTIEGFLDIVHMRENIAKSRKKPYTYRSYLWFERYFKAGDVT